MFRSIVLFTWAPDATDEQKKGVATALAELPDRIPVLRRLDFGPDVGTRPGNADFAVIADFDRPEDYPVYLEHPAHQELVTEHIRPIMAGRSAVQIEL